MCVGTSNTPRFGICPDVPSPLPSPVMSPQQSLVHKFTLYVTSVQIGVQLVAKV